MSILLLLFFDCLLCYKPFAAANHDFAFNISIFEPNKTSNCSDRMKELEWNDDGDWCDEIRDLTASEPAGNCTKYIRLNSARPYRSLKNTLERAAIQYCSGTRSFWPCFTCFNTATQSLWNRYPCPTYGKWREVPMCMGDFPNPSFNWSRQVVLNNTHEEKLVSHTLPPYNKCEALFNEYFKYDDFNVTFPIKMFRYPEDDEREYTVMLGLLMNAFENNNPPGTTMNETKYPYGIICEDFVDTRYLIDYNCRRTFVWPKVVPITVTDSFETLRADMCVNDTDCMSCFNQADSILFFYTRNMLMRASQIIYDYNRTSTIYKECFQEYNISQEYVAILNESHFGMDKVNMDNCSGSSQEQYNKLVLNPSYLDTSRMTQKYKVIVQTVAVNAYSYFGYAVRHNGTQACRVIEDGEMLCFVKNVIDMLDRLSTATSEAEEDSDIVDFTYNCKTCDSFEAPGDY